LPPVSVPRIPQNDSVTCGRSRGSPATMAAETVVVSMPIQRWGFRGGCGDAGGIPRDPDSWTRSIRDPQADAQSSNGAAADAPAATIQVTLGRCVRRIAGAVSIRFDTEARADSRSAKNSTETATQGGCRLGEQRASWSITSIMRSYRCAIQRGAVGNRQRGAGTRF